MTENNDTAHSPLLPCPFCGGRAEFVNYRDEWDEGGSFEYVRCQQCAARTDDIEEPEQSIIAWNTRHNNAELVSALRYILDDEDAPHDVRDRCKAALKTAGAL